MSTACRRSQGGGGPAHVDACGLGRVSKTWFFRRHKWMAPNIANAILTRNYRWPVSPTSLTDLHQWPYLSLSSTRYPARRALGSHNRNRSLQISKAQLKSQVQGTSLFTSAGCPKGSTWQAQVRFMKGQRHITTIRTMDHPVRGPIRPLGSLN